MIPQGATNRFPGREPVQAPSTPPNGANRRSAELAREMIGDLRARMGTGHLADRRATGHLDAGALLAAAPAAVDLEAVDLPGNTDALSLGAAKRAQTSKLRLA